MKTVVHVTHEAVQKIGGIGAVLHGLLTSATYHRAVGRDILLGPLFSTDGPAANRLHGGDVLYSSVDNLRSHPYGASFERIERDYGVGIVYGTKTFVDPLTGVTSHPEVLLIDVRHYNPDKMGVLKFILWEDYKVDSSKYEHIWDYEQYLRIAEPGLEAVRAIGACGEGATPLVVSHEYMGMPTALCARSKYPGQFRTVFYAHEVATMRRIVENAPGHDSMFYPVLEKAFAKGESVDETFGSQADFYRHPLVLAARYCDNIFAVGDYVVKELRFMHPEFREHHIDLAYNGVPARKLTLDEKLLSRGRLQQYCQNLLGFTPNFVFTHVTRLVPSKGLWRDIRVVEALEKHLAKKGETAVLFVLSTEGATRPSHDVLAMEQKYKWPVAHREGYPDLTGGEAHYYQGVQEWNARARQTKIVFLNQFGFRPATCGSRMPEAMEFLDIRKGSDVEFGQSIYEPFGIAQVEPISFGGICVFTELCGCAGLTRKAAGGQPLDNYLVVDYTQLPAELAGQPIEKLMAMDEATLETIERQVAEEAAAELVKRLPRTSEQIARLVEVGGKLGEAMSWDAVARAYILPAMEYALRR